MAINVGRVVGGGIIAGIVMNALDAVWGMFVMKADYEAMAVKFGQDPGVMQTFSGMMPWILADFIFGLLVVWTYAGLRPRFGPGIQTALVAAFVPMIAITTIMYGMMSMGAMPAALWAKSSMLGLITFAAGGIAGGWFYKE